MYKKTESGWTHNGVITERIGFVVDHYGYPLRDPIVIKHGAFDLVKAYYNEMKIRLINPDVLATALLDEDQLDFARILSESIMLIEASDWTEEEVNRCIDTLHYIKEVLREKKIALPVT